MEKTKAKRQRVIYGWKNFHLNQLKHQTQFTMKQLKIWLPIVVIILLCLVIANDNSAKPIKMTPDNLANEGLKIYNNSEYRYIIDSIPIRGYTFKAIELTYVKAFDTISNFCIFFIGKCLSRDESDLRIEAFYRCWERLHSNMAVDTLRYVKPVGK